MVRLLSVVAVITALSAAACSSRIHYPRPAGDRPPPIIRASYPATEFTYRQGRTFSVDGREGDVADFRVESLSMPSAGENGQDGNLVTARYFRSKQPGARPLVIILPIWGSSDLPSNLFSEHVREDGGAAVNILQIHGGRMLLDMHGLAYAPNPEEFVSLLDRMVDRIANTVIDIRRAVDWAESRPEIDSNRIVLVGFSIGAVVASLALANEPRLRGGVLVMGGARLHETIAVCDGAPGKMRELVANRFKWSVEQFREKIKTPLARIDPLRFAGRVNSVRLLIIEAGEDTCVPAAGRRRFWEAMGRPERIVYQYDHTTSFMAMTFLGGRSLQKEAFRFLKRVFALEPETRKSF